LHFPDVISHFPVDFFSDLAYNRSQSMRNEKIAHSMGKEPEI
jgi:hypothetical protein